MEGAERSEAPMITKENICWGGFRLCRNPHYYKDPHKPSQRKTPKISSNRRGLIMYFCRARLDSECAARRRDPKPKSFIFSSEGKAFRRKRVSERTATATPRLCEETPQRSEEAPSIKK